MSQPRTLWFISKYLIVPKGDEAGGRGFELLRELAARGHRCVLFVADASHLHEAPPFEGRYYVEKWDGVTICWVRTVRFAKASSLRRILSWLHFEWRLLALRRRAKRFGKPDTVVASSLSLFSVFSGLWFKARYRSRLVFEVRDVWPAVLLDEGWRASNPLVRLLGLVERLGYAQADVVIGTMPNLDERVREVLGPNRPKEVHCIPMGVARRTLGHPSSLPAGYADRWVPKNRFVVAYAGTFGSSNAMDPIFEAAALLAEDPGISFLMVGSGRLLERYQARCAELPNVVFAPRLAKDEVPALLKRSDLLIFSAHPAGSWRYGQSLNKLVDYMLAGKPVLAAYTGFQSMVNEAGCGTFVPAGDAGAIAREVRRYAAMDPRERDAIGERGRSWIIANRSFDRLAEDYEALLFPGLSHRG